MYRAYGPPGMLLSVTVLTLTITSALGVIEWYQLTNQNARLCRSLGFGLNLRMACGGVTEDKANSEQNANSAQHSGNSVDGRHHRVSRGRPR